MKAKISKIVTLLLVVILLGGFSKNVGKTVFVETENGEKVALKHLRFGLIKMLKAGRVAKEGKASGGEVFTKVSGAKFIIYPQNEINFKPGAAFGATWFVSGIDRKDQIVLKIQFDMPKVTKNGKTQRATSSIPFNLFPAMNNGDAHFEVELESGDPPGKYKMTIFNKDRRIASNTFHVRP